MKLPTYTATIYVGLREGYSGEEMPVESVQDYIQRWVDEIGMCVTVTPTEYIYSHGREKGVIVGFINYPRFPVDNETMRMQALQLGDKLLKFCKQMRISIVFPDETIMLTNDEEVKRYVDKKSVMYLTGIFWVSSKPYLLTCNGSVMKSYCRMDLQYVLVHIKCIMHMRVDYWSTRQRYCTIV